jgi:hypothetical protein
MSMHPHVSRFVEILAKATMLAALAAGGAGCHRSLQFGFDPRFSVNLMTPSNQWPDMKKMTPAEIEVYEKYGKPDFFRLLYSKRGELATHWEANPLIRAKKVNGLPKTWIYEDAGIEVRFRSPAKFEEIKLDDRMKTLLAHGDPSEISPLQSKDLAREAWTYWDTGEKYFFREDGMFARPKQSIGKGIGRNFTRM